MKKISYLLAIVSTVGLLHSCLLENDISYPYIKGEITAFEVEGQVSSSIDPARKQVKVVLEETADIGRVKVKTITLNPEASLSEELPEFLDLSERPLTVNVKTYQDYIWTISATQPIERYIRCEGQVGDAVFNYERQVTVYMSEGQDLKNITVNELKLAPEGAVYYNVDAVGERGEPVSFPCKLDNDLLSAFDVEYRGEYERWEIEFDVKKIDNAIVSVSPWCYSADVNAVSDGAGEPFIRYRKAGDETWTDFKDVTVSDNRMDITASLTGLEQETDYEAVLVVGDKESEPMAFRTGTPDQIDNMGFDEWYEGDVQTMFGPKKTWFPNPDNSVKIWDTANGGTVTMGKHATVPEYAFLATDEPSNKAAAKMESMNVAMFAAGNIYSGLFKKASLSGGVGAILDWGTPFSGRPKAIKGYYSYKPAVIDNAKAPYENLKGTQDKCQILVMLTDWDAPYTVDTAAGQFVDQENDPHIIAYAKYESDKDTGGKYEPFELVLDYRRPDATPKYAVVVACASYKGDYFTGGVGSVMYVDEFEFVYE